MIYSITHMLLGTIFKIFFRWRIIGLENVPTSGGVMVASNHISLWDPPVLGCGLPRRRPLHMMAKEELFAAPVFGWLITQLNSFPVRRGMADRNAIRTAINLLTAGEMVGIFPEGTRSKTGELGQAQPGMSMIAVKAGVPIIPAAITGTNKVFREGHLLPVFVVRYGKPLYPSPTKTDKENIEYMNSAVMSEIAKLMQSETV